jgi:hypothetical protein
MTVFIAYTAPDRPAAEALEKALERRGQFVELEDGARGFRAVGPLDVVIALWSQASVASPYRQLLERRTLDAWADERLVFIKLDQSFSPVGLRDLRAIDASVEGQRDIAWAAAVKSAHDILEAKRAPPPMPAPTPQRPAPTEHEARKSKPDKPISAPARRGKSGRGWLALFLGLIALLMVGSLAYWALRQPGVNAQTYLAWLPAIGAGFALLAISVVFVIQRGRGRALASAPATAGATPATPYGTPLFISYAHADAETVLPLAEGVIAAGRTVWIDRDGIKGGAGWAGEIVRAIRASGGVVVMCSPRAFESDHVKRELYLADRYKKPLLPVFVEPAAPPEDFEYFFAGIQWVNLHDKPANERTAAILAGAPA